MSGDGGPRLEKHGQPCLAMLGYDPAKHGHDQPGSRVRQQKDNSRSKVQSRVKVDHTRAKSRPKAKSSRRPEVKAAKGQVGQSRVKVDHTWRPMPPTQMRGLQSSRICVQPWLLSKVAMVCCHGQGPTLTRNMCRLKRSRHREGGDRQKIRMRYRLINERQSIETPKLNDTCVFVPTFNSKVNVLRTHGNSSPSGVIAKI